MHTSINPAIGRSLTHNPQQWLLLFNCQAAGLANCLSLQCTGVNVEFHDPASAAQNNELIAQRLDNYDRILVAPACMKGFSLEHRDNVWVVPPIQFHGYQPDWFLFSSEFVSRVGGPFGNLHSIIAYTAFSLGLDLKQALALYRDDVYSALGYYAKWDREAVAFHGRYEKSGLDMAGSQAKWSRLGAFMYLPIHPKIECMNDLARAILRRAGLPMTGTGVRPQDNLVGGPVFPVYPEIGRRLGVAGDYLFKAGGSYHMMDLPEFVAVSYRHYAQCADLTPTYPQFAESLRAARGVIADKAGIVEPAQYMIPPGTAEVV